MDKIDDSHLFFVRLWTETNGDGQREWCGRVQHIVTGYSRSFGNWSALAETMLALVPEDGHQDSETTEDVNKVKNTNITEREDKESDT